MACSRCGTDCNCACSGDPLSSQDWRRQVSLQVRAHKVRKRRRLDPDAPLLEFEEPDVLGVEEEIEIRPRRRSNWQWDQDVPAPQAHSVQREGDVSAESGVTVVAVEEPTVGRIEAVRDAEPSPVPQNRPPLPPFPRINAPVPKVIQFPRIQTRQYELADPVADQLRIFEAVDELPLPQATHLSAIEIAPQEPVHSLTDFEVPIQTAPLAQRIYAAAVDLALMLGALGIFTFCAEFFASSLPMTKPLLASGAACVFLLLMLYYLLALSLCRATPGMEASGLQVITFSGENPSRATLQCRALATVLSCAALGMGFAWGLIDEDRLCWHDRITHTYLSSK